MRRHADGPPVTEWHLYQPILAHFQARGFHAVSQVTDPSASRVEVDVVAFTPELDDVRIVEVKVQARGGLIDQCLDRLALAPRVYAAVPAGQADRLEALVDQRPEADALGVLAVGRATAEVVREAEASPEHREPGRAHVLERALRAALAEGRA